MNAAFSRRPTAYVPRYARNDDVVQRRLSRLERSVRRSSSRARARIWWCRGGRRNAAFRATRPPKFLATLGMTTLCRHLVGGAASAHALQKILNVERLWKDVDWLSFHARLNERRRCGAGHDDLLQTLRRVLRQRVEEREAVEMRHHQIENDDVVVDETEFEHRFHAVGRAFDDVTLALEHHAHETANGGIILDDENAARLRRTLDQLRDPDRRSQQDWFRIASRAHSFAHALTAFARRSMSNGFERIVQTGSTNAATLSVAAVITMACFKCAGRS